MPSKCFERIGIPLTEVPSDDIDPLVPDFGHPQPGQEDSLATAVQPPADEQPGDSISNVCEWEMNQLTVVIQTTRIRARDERG
jgi:hypothetical protein